MLEPRQARLEAQLNHGRIAYVDRGAGPAALFVHGVLLNADVWQPVVDRLVGVRRCICPDLGAHGWTRESEVADLSFAGQAQMLLDLMDALELEQVDLVGNDSGGGIAQILAARHPERVRSLTLTNCDTHDNWPPKPFEPTVTAVTGPKGADLLRSLAESPAVACAAFAGGFEDPRVLDEDTMRSLLGPLLEIEDRVPGLIRFFRAFDCADTVAVEPLLRQLDRPVLIVWGGADPFFDRRWAHWLRDVLPDVRRVVEYPRAKLFFPFERAGAFAAELRLHWGVSSG